MVQNLGKLLRFSAHLHVTEIALKTGINPEQFMCWIFCALFFIQMHIVVFTVIVCDYFIYLGGSEQVSQPKSAPDTSKNSIVNDSPRTPVDKRISPVKNKWSAYIYACNVCGKQVGNFFV